MNEALDTDPSWYASHGHSLVVKHTRWATDATPRQTFIVASASHPPVRLIDVHACASNPPALVRAAGWQGGRPRPECPWIRSAIVCSSFSLLPSKEKNCLNFLQRNAKKRECSRLRGASHA